MQGLRAADEAHRGHAETVGLQRLAGGGDHFGVVGKAQIIVGAQVDKLALAALRALVADADMRRLRRGNQPLALREPLGFDGGKLALQMGKEGLGHGHASDGGANRYASAPRVATAAHTRVSPAMFRMRCSG